MLNLKHYIILIKEKDKMIYEKKDFNKIFIKFPSITFCSKKIGRKNKRKKKIKKCKKKILEVYELVFYTTSNSFSLFQSFYIFI